MSDLDPVSEADFERTNFLVEFYVHGQAGVIPISVQADDEDEAFKKALRIFREAGIKVSLIESYCVTEKEQFDDNSEE